jgi:hypothetical protein
LIQVEQTQLDEEFARQLMLEDEQRYARDQIALRQQQQQQSRQQFPYATRVTPQQASSVNATINNNGAAEQQNTPQRDTMTDVQEQFSKLAESTLVLSPPPLKPVHNNPWYIAGKRTFSSFVSKVKAKVQEFDHSRYAENYYSPPFDFFDDHIGEKKQKCAAAAAAAAKFFIRRRHRSYYYRDHHQSGWQ